ncbi:MAG: peptidase S41 [Acidobacteria bacterium]|nr:peptidase S41 [Acidobacteriota bacterium]
MAQSRPEKPLAFVGAVDSAVRRLLSNSVLLSEFLPNALKRKGKLSLKQRRLLVDQALVLIEMNYAHLPLKRAIHAIDPVQQLKLLKFRLSEADEHELASELQFHEQMQAIFTSLRDFHTNYSLPDPFANKIAYLPILVEEFFGRRSSEPKFLITQVARGFEQPPFESGVEVLFWNGTPIKRAVELNGERQAGSNPEARFAAGLSALTIRPMIGSLPPDEFWVDLTYRTRDGRCLEQRLNWLVLLDDSQQRLLPQRDDTASKKMGIDLQRAVINQTRKILFAPDAVAAERRVRRAARRRVAIDDYLPTLLPTRLRARGVSTPTGSYGYIRIFNFEEPDTDKFVHEFTRLMGLLPQNGLIIDMRNNGGGIIDNGQRLLQLFTPREIEPELFEFICTPLNLEVCRLGAKSDDLAQWEDSIAQAVMTGATYSLGFPLTSKQACNDIGQRYYGPVVLIIDALCYSTTDMFIAGFRDHEIGAILGVNNNTGAGGANVWDHDDLLMLLRRRADSPFKPLPSNAGMRVAIRRSIRRGASAGTPLEELGVVPDKLHRMTRDDLMSRNVNLINQAGAMLSRKRVIKLSVEIEARASRKAIFEVKSENISRLDLYINDRPYKSLDVVGGKTRFTFALPTPTTKVLLNGFGRRGDLVAVVRRTINARQR